MFIKTSPRTTRRGFTLVEMMVAVAIFSICGLVLMSLYLFCVKGMASMYNYVLLDQYDRQAMNQLTTEIRQAIQVVGYTTNSITILTLIFHGGIEQRSGERVRRLVNIEPNETATHRFFEDRL